MRKLKRQTKGLCSAIAYAKIDPYKILYRGNRPPPEKLEPGKCAEMDAIIDICEKEESRQKNLDVWINIRRSRLNTKDKIERKIRETPKTN